VSAPSVISPEQRNLLDAFFTRSASRNFFLTGGTALAEFYLHHRYSEDLDLFTLDNQAFSEAARELPNLAAELGSSFEERVATPTFHQVFFRLPNQPEIKVDLVRDAGPQFGQHQNFDKVIADSELNIAANKITAIFGRASNKDFVDLYFLLKRGFDLDQLIELAKQKDPGLNEFYLSGMIRQIRKIESLPRMIKPVTLDELRAFFLPLAEQIMLKTKPNE